MQAMARATGRLTAGRLTAGRLIAGRFTATRLPETKQLIIRFLFFAPRRLCGFHRNLGSV